MKHNKGLIFTCCLIILITCIFCDKISDFLANLISQNFEAQSLINNSYSKNNDYGFFEIPKDNIPLSKKELVGTLFSAINAKEDKFTFYCPNEYYKCLKDIEDISNDELLLTHLNNFVHPYNSFTNIKTTISESGEISLDISYLYTDEEIVKLEETVTNVLNQEITEEMDEYEKLKAIHDYIANNTRYDVERNENGNSKYDSYKATGTLLDGVATCNGYADALAIFLTRLGYDNYKIATTPGEISYESTGHVWNAVKFDNEWVHIDLTWDDPVSKDGRNYLYHKFFLVNNEEMKEADSGDVNIEEHNFDKTIYLEFKN